MKKYIIFVLLASCSYLVSQQNQLDRSSFYSYGTRMFSEAHTLPSDSPDSINVLVMFKVVHEALLFVQANPLENPGSFQAIPSVEIFFKDELGIIKNRTLWTDTLWVNSYEDTKSKYKYSEGFVYIRLPIMNYNCTVQLLDRYRKPADKSEIKLNSKINFSQSGTISDPIFAYSNPDLPAYKMVPFILENKINFTSKDSKILIPVSYKQNYDVFNYLITKSISNSEQIWNDSVSYSGRVSPVQNSYLGVERSKQTPVLLTIKTSISDKNNESASSIGILSIELPSTSLSPGSYSLRIFNDNNKSDTAKFEFEVIWIDMPLALRNPQYAIESMYYILNDEEYNKMKSGNAQEQANKLMNYWKAKDPTKNTPFNEAMTEYFRRVDYAFFNFQTVRDKDGSKTERGKIHILFGKPDNSDKVLSAGKQYEVWTYNKLKKKFHFELVSNGLYQLIKIEE